MSQDEINEIYELLGVVGKDDSFTHIGANDATQEFTKFTLLKQCRTTYSDTADNYAATD